MHAQQAILSLVLLGSSSVCAAQEQLKVVTTLKVLADIAAAVGGDLVQADHLCHPAQDPHQVRARPTLMKKVRDADVFIRVGLSLETWAQRVLDGAGNNRIQRGQTGHIVATSGIEVLGIPNEISRSQGHIHADGNPHMWIDPLRARAIATNIASGLARVAPGRAANFETSLARYQRRLDEALFGTVAVEKVGGDQLAEALAEKRLLKVLGDVELGGWLAKAGSLRGKSFITYHDNWIYLADRFGFAVPINIEKLPGIPPSAKHRDLVIETARDGKAKGIICAAYYSTKASEFVAERSGCPLLILPLDVGSDPRAGDYFALIDLLLDKLQNAAGS